MQRWEALHLERRSSFYYSKKRNVATFFAVTLILGPYSCLVSFAAATIESNDSVSHSMQSPGGTAEQYRRKRPASSSTDIPFQKLLSVYVYRVVQPLPLETNCWARLGPCGRKKRFCQSYWEAWPCCETPQPLSIMVQGLAVALISAFISWIHFCFAIKQCLKKKKKSNL